MKNSDIYIPRKKETEDFFRLIKEGNNIHLIGHDNVGKTTFVKHIFDENNIPEDIKDRYLPVYYSFLSFRQRKNTFSLFSYFPKLIYRVIKKECANIKEPELFLNKDKIEESKEQTIRYINNLSDFLNRNCNKKLLIIVDDLYRFGEDLNPYPWAKGIIEIAERQKDVQWIFIDNGNNLSNVLSEKYNIFNLNRLSDNELKNYLEKNLSDLSSKKMHDFLQQTKGIPYLVNELLTNMSLNNSYDDASYAQANCVIRLKCYYYGTYRNRKGACCKGNSSLIKKNRKTFC